MSWPLVGAVGAPRRQCRPWHSLPNRRPRWFNLGRSCPPTAGFAYTDEKGLWTVDGKAGVRQLVAGEGLSLPIISPDRSRVAYRVQRDDHSELWTVRWDGADAALLLNESELPVTDLPAGYTERRLNDVRWLPERNVLAVTTVAVPGSADLAPSMELWQLNVESGALQHVADMGRAVSPVLFTGWQSICSVAVRHGVRPHG